MNSSTRNIIFITNLHLWSLDAGKGGKAFYHTVNGYIDAGWNVVLISTGGNIPENIYSRAVVIENRFSRLEELQENSSKIISVLVRFFKIYSMNRYFVRAAKKALANLKTKNIVIYAYEVEGVAAAKRISQKYNLPLVTRFQGTVITNVDDTWLNRIRRTPHFSALKTEADLVIMTNDGTQGNQTLARLGNKSINIKFLKNGVDGLIDSPKYERISQRELWNLSLDDFVFVTVSRLISWKRVDVAIISFAKIAFEFPNTHLVIVGDGPEKSSLLDLTRSLRLTNRITFTGSVHQVEVKKILGMCDAFLSFYELSNLGNPIMEAMVTGLPLITVDVGDTRELIQDNVNGLLVEYNKLDKIPYHMQRLITDNDLRNRLANGALSTAKSEFLSWDDRINIELCDVSKIMLKTKIINVPDVITSDN